MLNLFLYRCAFMKLRYRAALRVALASLPLIS
jgi:hypothetical protein